MRRELAGRERLSGKEGAAAGDERDRVEEEMGDLLFALVNTGRFLRLCPEEALRLAVAKFERRFRAVEERFHSEGRELEDASLEEMDRVWEKVKELEG